MKKITCLLVLFFIAGGLRAQNWTNFYSGPVSGVDQVSALAADGNGNVYAVGQSAGASNSLDYATVKFSSSGVLLWTSRYAGAPGFKAVPTAIGLDSSTNVFVTGYANHNGSGPDFVTIKYNPAGVPQWTNIYNGPGNGTDEAYGLAVDSANNVYVVGTVTNTSQVSNLGLIKYSNTGLVLWTVLYNRFGTNGSFGGAVKLDAAGNVIVAGCTINNGFTNYLLTVKFSSSGTPIWTNITYQPIAYNDNMAVNLAVDNNSNVLVSRLLYTGTTAYAEYVTLKCSAAGVSVWTNQYYDPTSIPVEPLVVAFDRTGNAYAAGPATIKYSTTGTPLWTNKYEASDGFAAAIAVDSRTNIFVTGHAYSGASQTDFLTLGYSTAGVMTVSNRYEDSGNYYDFAYAMALDSNDNVIVGGGVSIFSFDGPVSIFAVINYKAATTTTPPPYFSILTASGSGFGFSNKVFGFTVSGPAGSNAVVQFSTNLMTWTPLKTNSLGLGVTNFIDPQSSNTNRRFYRALLRP